jgi:hypothetical protein
MSPKKAATLIKNTLIQDKCSNGEEMRKKRKIMQIDTALVNTILMPMH